MKAKRTKLDGYIFGALAKIWRWWPARATVIKRCTRKVEGKEQTFCEKCKQWFDVVVVFSRRKSRRKRQTEVDHIKPKIDVKKGFQGWDILINRTFVSDDELQNLCKACHRIKTNSENSKRRRK